MQLYDLFATQILLSLVNRENSKYMEGKEETDYNVGRILRL
jgi:hypothetical protein